MNGIAFLHHIHKPFVPYLLVALVDLIPDNLKNLNSFAIFQAPYVLIQTAKVLEEGLLEQSCTPSGRPLLPARPWDPLVWTDDERLGLILTLACYSWL